MLHLGSVSLQTTGTSDCGTLHARIDCVLLEAIENALINSLERHWIAGRLLDNASFREDLEFSM